MLTFSAISRIYRRGRTLPLTASVACLLAVLGQPPATGKAQDLAANEVDGGFRFPDDQLPDDDGSSEPVSDEAIFFRDPVSTAPPEELPSLLNTWPAGPDRFTLESNRTRVDTGFSLRGGMSASDRFYDGLGGIPQPLLLDLRPPATPEDFALRVGPVKFRFRLGAGVNVTRQSGSRQEEGTETQGFLLLGVSGLLGDPQLGRYLQLDYDAAPRIGTRDGDDFRVDQSFNFRGGMQMAKLRLEAAVNYTSLSGVDREFSEGVNRDFVNISGSAHYAATEKTSFDFNLAVPIQEYGEGLSSVGVTSTNFFNYAVTPKTILGVGVAGGFVEVEKTGTQTFEQVLLRAVSTFSPSLAASLTGGVDFRQTDGELRVEPIFALSGVWVPREGTSLSLIAERRVRNSAAVEDTDFTATSVTFGVTQRLGERFQVRPAIGYEFASYEGRGAEQSNQSSRDDQTFFAQIGASAALFRNCSVTASITYRVVDSTINDQRNVQGSLQVTYQF